MKPLLSILAVLVATASAPAWATGPCEENPCANTLCETLTSTCTCYRTRVDPEPPGGCLCAGLGPLTGPTCRAPVGPCDVADTCVDGACPDSYAPAGTNCGSPPMMPDPETGASVCDLQNKCTGLSVSCPEIVKTSGTECRASADLCDIAETCNGVSKDCPADLLRPSGATCRPAVGACDGEEQCSGESVACPTDSKLPGTTLCRPAGGVCDVAEFCDGTTDDCPSDLVSDSSTVCRAATDVCDPAEMCPGDGVDCPADFVESNETACDDGDACTGPDECTAGVCGGADIADCEAADAGPSSPDAGLDDGVDAGNGAGPDANMASGDAGEGDGNGDGGCGCRASGRPGGGAGWLLVVVAAVLALGGSRRRMLPIVMLAGLSAVGCRPHVALRSPGPSAAGQERIAAFERLQSRGRMDVVRTRAGQPIERRAEYLVLANGQRVYHADDLLTVVGDDSAAGRAANESASARRKKIAWYIAGVVVATAGVALLTTADYDASNPEAGLPAAFYWSMGLAAAGTAGALVGVYYGRKETDARAAAFMTYDESLMQQLHLCAHGTRIVDCAKKSASSANDHQATWGGVAP